MLNSISSTINNVLNSTIRQTSKVDKATETEKATELTEQEKLEAFKKEIWKEIDGMPKNSSVNFSIQITDDAFKRMMNEPEFKNKMLSLLREEGRVARPPISSSMSKIDKNGYTGTTYNFGSGEEIFKAHSNDKNSFYTKKAPRKINYNDTKHWEEMSLERRLLEQRFQAKELQEIELEKNRQTAKKDESIRLQKVIAEYEKSIYNGLSDL